ncbi:MAG: hypothetical protein BWY26_01040 [Elusimicrobia bacterium ADurb.Bin231]|nr:MAG: hypothetical protein BWY26_01040 [Elusimicrobia bacterium ADurb.Bin231]
MDGKGRAYDNIFVELLWRSVKYEDVYLNGYETMPEAKAGLEKYFDLYNRERFHQSLEYQTPEQIYFDNGRNLEKIAGSLGDNFLHLN